MGIIAITTDRPGQIGDKPRVVSILSSDSLAEVTTAGYLNPVTLQGYTIYSTDEIHMWYDYVSGANTGTFAVFLPTITNGVITLAAWTNQAGLGTMALQDASAVAITGGTAVFNNTGLSILDSNATHRLTLTTSSDLTANRTLTFITSDTNRTFNLSAANVTVSAFGASLVDDADAATARATLGAQSSANILANRTADIGGGGAGPISVAVAGLTAASIVNANIESSTNTVSVAKVTPTATGFDILFSADPGASCVVGYSAFIAVQ